VHSANSYLKASGKLEPDSVLNAAERRKLETLLREDAKDYYQAALVSLIDGLRSISSGFYSWSTVKLYYCTFYALRARLAVSGECIFYDQSKPRYIDVSPGCLAKKLAGNTHKCVLDRFSLSHPNDFFLSQDIASRRPLDWLMERREEVNYKMSRFSEPGAPEHFKFAETTDVRRMLGSYQLDDVYIFDPDHAVVAFPFRLMLDLRIRLSNVGVSPLAEHEIEFLSKNSKDRSGLIAALNPLLT
jgi:uncharacterized protein (UPF0332 family)